MKIRIKIKENFNFIKEYFDPIPRGSLKDILDDYIEERYLSCVKRIKDSTGLGLKESKDVMDRLKGYSTEFLKKIKNTL